MTPTKLKSVFAFYLNDLDEGTPDIKPVQLTEEMAKLSFAYVGMERKIAHVKFMCVEGQKFVDEGRIDKAMHWLGCVQGVLWAVGRFPLDDLKNHSRP